jgi:hypothetical protein
LVNKLADQLDDQWRKIINHYCWRL